MATATPPRDPARSTPSLETLSSAPSIAHPSDTPEDDFIRLSDVASFLLRHRLLMAGCALATGLVTALALLLLTSPAYEASATLAIVPPRFSSELVPPTLTVQGYQTLLESDSVVAETKQKLVKAGNLEPDDLLRVDHELESRIFVANRSETTTLAPMLQAIGKGKTPEQAAALANTWAAVFLARARDLAAGSTSPTVQFIDRQFPLTRDALTRLEDQKTSLFSQSRRDYDVAADRWDRRVMDYRGESADLRAAWQAESRRLLEEFDAAHTLQTRQVRLDALRTAYADLQGEQARVNAQLKEKELQLTSTAAQLAATPPVLTLRKAVTDDALWDKVLRDEKGQPDWQALQNKALVSQQVNPLYTELSARHARLQTDVGALRPRAAQLQDELKNLATEMQSMETALRRDTAAREKLKLDREAGFTRLKQRRETGLAELTRDRERELDVLKRTADTRLGQLERQVSQEKELYGSLAKNFNQAQLAKAQTEVEDVRLAAPAVRPELPQPRGIALKTLLALVLGGGIGLVAGAFRDAAAQTGTRS